MATVRDVIRSGIRHGIIKPGTQLGEDEFGVSMHASRASVRAAFQMLANEGLLERRTRSGTRVRTRPIQIDVRGMFPDEQEFSPMISVLARDQIVPPPPLVRSLLGIDDELVRLREYRSSVDDEVIAVRVAYRQRQFTGRGAEEPRDDIEAWFESVFGVPFGSVQTTIEFAVCDARSAKDMGLEEGAPLLVREQIFRDREGRARELAFLEVRADRVEFTDSR